MDTTPIVEARNVSVVYRRRVGWRTIENRAVEQFSLAIGSREIVALVGESGSGKSTIGKLFLKMLNPSQGEVLLKGSPMKARSVREFHALWRHVQLIFQDPFAALNPANTVEKILVRPLMNYRRLSGDRLRDAVHQLLTDVGLTPPESYLTKYSYQLSGGQKQRVVIARALASDPEVIIADEPISMLDVSIKAGILLLMDRIRNERKVSYLYITHDLISAYHIADRIVVLYQGRKMEEGAAEDVVGNPSHPYTRLLLESVPNPHRENAVSVPQHNRPRLSQQGCPFAARCPLVMEVCLTTFPDETSVSPGHQVSCYAVQGEM